MKHKSVINTDIAIIGAGPSGLFLAYFLLKNGFSNFLLIDQYNNPEVHTERRGYSWVSD